jgi:NAD(P)-dependent dehydrogenase (short-subunit alcohol dehydrogenase family)
MDRLEGKRIVVTGAASGLGLASAQRFVSEGARVVFVDLKPDQLEEAVANLGAGATGKICDVTDEHAVAELVKSVATELGGIDCYYNNAGVAHAVTPLEQLRTRRPRGARPRESA